MGSLYYSDSIIKLSLSHDSVHYAEHSLNTLHLSLGPLSLSLSLFSLSIYLLTHSLSPHSLSLSSLTLSLSLSLSLPFLSLYLSSHSLSLPPSLSLPYFFFKILITLFFFFFLFGHIPILSLFCLSYFFFISVLLCLIVCLSLSLSLSLYLIKKWINEKKTTFNVPVVDLGCELTTLYRKPVKQSAIAVRNIHVLIWRRKVHKKLSTDSVVSISAISVFSLTLTMRQDGKIRQQLEASFCRNF